MLSTTFWWPSVRYNGFCTDLDIYLTDTFPSPRIIWNANLPCTGPSVSTNCMCHTSHIKLHCYVFSHNLFFQGPLVCLLPGLCLPSCTCSFLWCSALLTSVVCINPDRLITRFSTQITSDISSLLIYLLSFVPRCQKPKSVTPRRPRKSPRLNPTVPARS